MPTIVAKPTIIAKPGVDAPIVVKKPEVDTPIVVKKPAMETAVDKRPTKKPIIKKQKTATTGVVSKDNIFKLRDTNMPDVYELHRRMDGEYKMEGYAAIPDIKTSQLVNEAFEKNETVYMRCEYSAESSSWKPILAVESD